MDDRVEQEVSVARARPGAADVVVFTIGHSVRALDAFLALLSRHGIQRVVDVRRYPGSRRHPHFGSEALAAALRMERISYTHMAELGGRRTAARDSPNVGWRNAGFRGYADYMGSVAFGEALATLRRIARAERTAIMCAEALPWRCHRSLIADALVARGDAVVHIMDAELRPHALPPFATVRDGRLFYPGRARDDAPPGLFGK